MYDQISVLSENRATYPFFSVNRIWKGRQRSEYDKKKETSKGNFKIPEFERKENYSVTNKLISYKQLTLPGIPFARSEKFLNRSNSMPFACCPPDWFQTQNTYSPKLFRIRIGRR